MKTSFSVGALLRGLALAFLVGAVSLAFSADAADEKKPGKAPSDLHKQMIGAWKVVSNADGTPLEAGFEGQIKFIGEKNWVAVGTDPNTKKVTFTLGGTYTLEGDKYVEKIEFANDLAAEMVGQKVEFKVKIDGDKFTQIGVGNPYSQTFKRAN